MSGKTPLHVAIIPDGNRRWARERGLAEVKGHEDSTRRDRLIELFEEARAMGVKYLSLWGFSTENWNRSKIEKRFLFKLVGKTVEQLRDYAVEKKVRFRHIGRRDRLPRALVESLERLEKDTEKFDSMNVQLFLDYGGRDEILRAVEKAKLAGEILNENNFMNYLDTSGLPEPELIIRTGGEKRLSGFMSFQSIYSELYFTDSYFPDFGTEEFRKAINWFSSRERRFGK